MYWGCTILKPVLSCASTRLASDDPPGGVLSSLYLPRRARMGATWSWGETSAACINIYTMQQLLVSRLNFLSCFSRMKMRKPHCDTNIITIIFGFKLRDQIKIFQIWCSPSLINGLYDTARKLKFGARILFWFRNVLMTVKAVGVLGQNRCFKH